MLREKKNKNKNNHGNMGDKLERGETTCFCNILGKRALDLKTTAIKIHSTGAPLEILQK